MKNINELASGFQIKNLILSEVSFSRINIVQFGETIKANLDINIDVEVSGKTITVFEEVALIQKFQDIEQVKIKVKMIGIFECVGETTLTDLEEFGRVNGAAIIYPYIREHITSLSLKAGLAAIILPPVNFTKNKK